MFPLKIHKTQLPKIISKDIYFNKDGFIEGFVQVNEKDTEAVFMNNKPLFELTRPVILAQTHLMIRFYSVIFTGIDSKGNKTGISTTITAMYNFV